MVPSNAIIFLIFLRWTRTSSNMCTNIDILSKVEMNIIRVGSQFLEIERIGVMGCAKQCLLRRRCRMFNFMFSPRFLCGLESMNSTEALVHPFNGTVSSDIDLWPETLIGECQGHTCGMDEMCNVTSPGVRECVYYEAMNK